MAGEKKTTADKAAKKTTEKAKTKTAAVKKADSKAAGKTADKAAKKTTEKAKTAAAGKTVKKAESKTAGKTAGKAVKKAEAAEKTAGKTTRTTAGKAAGVQAKTRQPARVQSGGRASQPRQDQKSLAEDKAFIDQMEQSLLVLKAEINENLISTSNDFMEIVEGMDPKDLADIASDDIDRKIIEALGSQVLKNLKQIDSALNRIKQGSYGFCIKCGRQIPHARLEALPYALMCIECKSEEEKRNR